VALVAGAVANPNPAEPVKDICDRLNANTGLASVLVRKCLPGASQYQAAQDGMAGKIPKKRGPSPVTLILS
jgi:hypothetical protein